MFSAKRSPRSPASGIRAVRISRRPSGANHPTPRLPPSPARLRPGVLIAVIVAVVVAVVAVVVGAQLLRGHSQNRAVPSTVNARPSAQPSPFLLTRYITDRSGVLTPEGRIAVQGALNKLYTDRKVHLWVAYVPGFDNLGPLQWGLNAVRDNGFTDTDALLAINTTLRIYAFQVPPAIVNEAAINISEVRRKGIEPAVISSDWSGAALAAVKGLDPTAIGG
jgi:serine/threonine protein kinase, bacterial